MNGRHSDDYWEQVAEARAEAWMYTTPRDDDRMADRAADRHEKWMQGETP